MTYDEIDNMDTTEKYETLINFSDDINEIAEFATSIYGMNDDTLSNITYYFFGVDGIDEWIHDYV